MAGKDTIRLDITAEDKASEVARYVAATMAGLEAEPVVVEVDANTSDAEQGLENVKRKANETEPAVRGLGDTADQSRSVLANMAGNTAGELSELGGAAGPAGVAIGQLAEYAADGNIKLRSLVGLGVGMVVLAGTMKLVQDRMARIAKEKAFDKQRVEDWTAALREGATASAAITDSLQEAGEVVVNISGHELDFTRGLAAMGVGVEEWTALITGSEENLEAWADSMRAAGADSTEVALVVAGVREEMKNLEGAEEAAAASAEFFGDSQKDAADAADTLTDSLLSATEVANDWLDAQLAAADASFAAHDAQRDFEAAVQDTRDAMADGASTAEDLEDAYRSERDAAIDAASAAARLADEQARQAGTTLDAEGRLDALNASLLDSARTATPAARDQIAQYIAEVNGIPLEKATDIIANPDTEAARRELDDAANPGGRPRVGEIEVAVKNQLGLSDLFASGVLGRSGAPSVSVTVNAPRGMSGAAIAAEVGRYVRRNGGRGF